jgi:hypothetical protein
MLRTTIATLTALGSLALVSNAGAVVAVTPTTTGAQVGDACKSFPATGFQARTWTVDGWGNQASTAPPPVASSPDACVNLPTTITSKLTIPLIAAQKPANWLSYLPNWPGVEAQLQVDEWDGVSQFKPHYAGAIWDLAQSPGSNVGTTVAGTATIGMIAGTPWRATIWACPVGTIVTPLFTVAELFTSNGAHCLGWRQAYRSHNATTTYTTAGTGAALRTDPNYGVFYWVVNALGQKCPATGINAPVDCPTKPF